MLAVALLAACFGAGGNDEPAGGQGQTLFVDSQNNTGKADGTQAHPYISIQNALDAQKGGEVIRIAAGTYSQNLRIKKNVHLCGETASNTILAGDDARVLLTTDDTVTRVRVTRLTLRDGFSSTAGVIDTDEVDLRFDDCLFTSNGAGTSTFNAAIVRVDGGSLTMNRCVFLDNDSTCVSVIETSACAITNCLLAMQSGFGVYVRGLGSTQAADVLLTNVTISGSSGSGVFMANFGDARLQNVVLHDNQNALFEGKFAGDPRLFYNDLQNGYHDADTDSWLVDPAEIDALDPPAVNVGTVVADPLFVDAAAGDYALAVGSPCIDTGDPALKDADGTRSDMGAFGGPGGAFDSSFVTSQSRRWSTSSAVAGDLRALLDLDPRPAVAGQDHLCDLDHDGRPDRLRIALHGPDRRGLMWRVERRKGHRRPAPLPSGLADVIRATTYDVDGDGDLDLVVEHIGGWVDVHPSLGEDVATLAVLARPGDTVLISSDDRAFRRLVHARGDRPDGAHLFALGDAREVQVQIFRDDRTILTHTARAGDLIRAPETH